MTTTKLYLRTKKGVSLLIGIVLIAIITAFAMGISNVVISAIRNTGNVNNANMAYYAAEGALEQGLLQSALQGAGYDATPVVTLCTIDQVCPTATVKIQGTVPAGSNIGYDFVIPTPGTGTAGTNCNPLTAVTSYFDYDYVSAISAPVHYTDISPLEHPCNWNKVKVGETVSIPLYTTSTSGSTNPTTTVKNPTELELTSLKIKIRTPCKNGAEMCPFSERYKLNTLIGDSYFKCEAGKYYCGDVIVSWQIVAQDKTGAVTYTFLPNNDSNDLTKDRLKTNSEIYEGHISDMLDGARIADSSYICPVPYCVLYEGRKGKLLDTGKIGSILDFLKNGTLASGNLPILTGNSQINKPMLKLSVVHSINEDTENKTIPYLEYQITTNSNLTSPPADTAQTITAEGLSGTFKQVLEVKQPQESGLLEYVIQQ